MVLALAIPILVLEINGKLGSDKCQICLTIFAIYRIAVLALLFEGILNKSSSLQSTNEFFVGIELIVIAVGIVMSAEQFKTMFYFKLFSKAVT